MSSTQKNFALPLAFIGIMFFAIGFALGINSVLIPVLQGSLGITSAESYLIIAATFVPFLIFGYPASMTIKAIGYKHTMALSFAMFAVAFGLYIPSVQPGEFSSFLVASFVSGTVKSHSYKHLLTPILLFSAHWTVQPNVSASWASVIS